MNGNRCARSAQLIREGVAELKLVVRSAGAIEGNIGVCVKGSGRLHQEAIIRTIEEIVDESLVLEGISPESVNAWKARFRELVNDNRGEDE